ncbi:SDR family oxidoreductase [Flaviramulus sp. BrNp1-15]|uniref:SDR family NAD(P)-dependent oxidoreductase n=1 Tax=Flaviramulus sp. BrNp1-15 TaxID=2916754 RepID=UPI001EE97963|nr:SDR family oxidoreductase [Flaviramulus sp. BrNp1-15]ULC57900.1 SDR family oxidoreductase [Flaviramulus sp. BrNp1-15]
MKTLQDKVAIITGGSGGIGKATAKLFLSEGAKVMLVSRSEEKLKKVLKELNNENLAYCAADVAKTEDTKKYIKETLAKFGQIDVFFNNAGIEGDVKPIKDYSETEFDRVIATNIKGVWLGCQHVIPKMKDGGSVIITSSVAGIKGFSGLGPYVASKHAVVGIMRVAAIEFANHKIRVNTIHPGPVNTRMMRSIEESISPGHAKEVQKGFEADVLFKRYAEPEEIAQLVLFLASDSSKYITGSMQVIDGGMHVG